MDGCGHGEFLFPSGYSNFEWILKPLTYHVNRLLVIVISLTMFFDWLKVQNEFVASALGESEERDLYKSTTITNRLCTVWRYCAHTQNISWMLIWSEIIKRFLNNILDTNLHVIILFAVIVTTVSLMYIDHGVFLMLMTSAKTLVCYFVVFMTIVLSPCLHIMRV